MCHHIRLSVPLHLTSVLLPHFAMEATWIPISSNNTAACGKRTGTYIFLYDNNHIYWIMKCLMLMFFCVLRVCTNKWPFYKCFDKHWTTYYSNRPESLFTAMFQASMLVSDNVTISVDQPIHLTERAKVWMENIVPILSVVVDWYWLKINSKYLNSKAVRFLSASGKGASCQILSNAVADISCEKQCKEPSYSIENWNLETRNPME